MTIGFLDLPLGLRYMVYHHAFAPTGVIVVNSFKDHISVTPQLGAQFLRTCKLIHAEAREVLYTNKVCTHIDAYGYAYGLDILDPLLRAASYGLQLGKITDLSATLHLHDKSAIFTCPFKRVTFSLLTSLRHFNLPYRYDHTEPSEHGFDVYGILWGPHYTRVAAVLPKGCTFYEEPSTDEEWDCMRYMNVLA